MRKLALLFLFLLLGLSLGVKPLGAQLAPVPLQGNGTLEGSHLFAGLTFNGVSISWPSATTPRWLMIFDAAALPANGATSGCTTTTATSCLAYCLYLPESTVAPNRFTLDWTIHPALMHNGVVVALSTAANCGTLTVDGANDYFFAQVH